MMPPGAWTLTSVFDALTTPSLVVEQQYRIAAINRAATELFAVERDSIMGAYLSELWPSDEYLRLHGAAASLFDVGDGQVFLPLVTLLAEAVPAQVSVTLTHVASNQLSFVLLEIARSSEG